MLHYSALCEFFFFSSRRRHTRCALVTGVQTCALPIYVPAGADIVVATDSPYVLGRSSAPVRIATYGDTPGAMKALIGVLTGKATAPGKLPVAVSGVARTGC